MLLSRESLSFRFVTLVKTKNANRVVQSLVVSHRYIIISRERLRFPVHMVHIPLRQAIIWLYNVRHIQNLNHPALVGDEARSPNALVPRRCRDTFAEEIGIRFLVHIWKRTINEIGDTQTTLPEEGLVGR